MTFAKRKAKKVWEKIFQKRCNDCEELFDIDELVLYKKGEIIQWNSKIEEGYKEKIILEVTKDFWLCPNCVNTFEPKFCDSIRCNRGFSACYSSKGCEVYIYERGEKSRSYFIPKRLKKLEEKGGK